MDETPEENQDAVQRGELEAARVEAEKRELAGSQEIHESCIGGSFTDPSDPSLDMELKS